MRRGTPFLALALLALLVLAPLRADADAGTEVPILALEWTAPSGCPDGAQVTGRVEELVGRSRGDKTLAADGSMTASDSPPRYRLVLRVGGDASASTERTMTGGDCARLAEAAAVVLALDIDHEHDASTQDTAKPTPEPDELPPPAAPRAPRAPRTARAQLEEDQRKRERLDLDVTLRARLSLDHGSLPRATLGLGAGAEVARGDLSLDLGGTVYQRQFVGGPRGGAAGAYVDLALVETHGCLRRTLASIGIRACVGVEMGREGTVGVGIQVPRSSAGLWAAGSVSLEARAWPQRVLSPAAGVSLGHPFAAPDVVVHGFGALFERPDAFVRTHVGLDFRQF